jgi:hypothetical protein
MFPDADRTLGEGVNIYYLELRCLCSCHIGSWRVQVRVVWSTLNSATNGLASTSVATIFIAFLPTPPPLRAGRKIKSQRLYGEARFVK